MKKKMAGRKKRSVSDDELETDIRSNDSVLQVLTNLVDKVNINLDFNAQAINNLAKNLENSFGSISNSLQLLNETVQHKIPPATGNLQANAAVLFPEDSSDHNRNENAKKGWFNEQMHEDRKYITLFKDLGGNNIHFSPGGSLHPVLYVRKLSNLFEDAGVPENKKVRLAINGLRGSALDWGSIKEKNICSFDEFKRMFLARYWSTEEERELFHKIKYGRYERGSRADYFLRIVGDADYLTEALTEAELVELVSKHFPAEVYRGILNAGYQTIDEIERHLRKMDRTYETERPQGHSNWREQNNSNLRTNRNAVPPRRVGGPDSNSSNGNNNNAVVVNQPGMQNINVVNESRNGTQGSSASANNILNNGEELLDNDDEDVKRSLSVLPTILFSVASIPTKVLIDSGSQITCISQSFDKRIRALNLNVPRLPTNCRTVVGAMGDKSQNVREQVFLEFARGNVSFEYTCAIVPKLVQDVILGCDWMMEYSVNLDFKEGRLLGVFKGVAGSILFENSEAAPPTVLISEVRVEEEDGEMYETQAVDDCSYGELDFQKVVLAANVDEQVKQDLKELLWEFRNIFLKKPGLTDFYVHEIELHDYSPFFIKPYPIPHVYREEVRRQLKEMENWGVIQCGRTEYVSPLVVVRKKDGSIRVCLDARWLNKRMVFQPTES